MAKILVVDDRKTNRDLFATILRHCNHGVFEAPDGEAALEAVRTSRPDLVISDILMPKMDGFELVRAMRADPASASVPVIFTSAHYLSREADALASKSGVSIVLRKPVEPETLLGAVEQALSGEEAPRLDRPLAELSHDHMRVVTDKLKEKVDELRGANALLAALDEFSHTLSAEKTPEGLARILCASARRMLGARHTTVGLLDERGMAAEHLVSAGWSAEAGASAETIGNAESLIRRCIAKRGVATADFLPGDPRDVGLPASHPRVNFGLCAPIFTPQRAYGYLFLAEKIGVQRFIRTDEDLAANLAGQMGRALENVLLQRRAQRRTVELEAEVGRRRASEAALRESEDRIRMIADTMPGLLWMCDARGQTSFANRSWTEYTGNAPSSGQLLRVDALVHPDDAEAFASAAAAAARSHQPFFLEHRLRGADGGYRWFLHSVSPTYDAAGQFTGYVGVLVDATARRELEAQLRQAQKLESVGRLTGGIAHDFNNLLTVILGSADMLKVKLDAASPLRRLADGIETASLRAADLTGRLLTFSRQQVLNPRAVDLAKLVEGIHDMVARSVGEDVDIVVRSAPGEQRVFADPMLIESALLNLVVNARDAMPEGGRLTIETAVATLAQGGGGSAPDAPAGTYGVLTVSDTGTGMTPDVLARACEPFYTTKEIGKGTGLGLSMVHGFAHQSGGFLKIESAIGRGTTISLHLPLRVAEAAPDRAPNPDSEIRGGGETILLVEDNEMVRGYAVDVLGDLGYTVLEARDAKAALAVLERPAAVDLVLSDVVMPGGMSGYQLAEAARKRNAGVRVLLMSGYADQARPSAEASLDRYPLLAKPFQRAGLARAVRLALECPLGKPQTAQLVIPAFTRIP